MVCANLLESSRRTSFPILSVDDGRTAAIGIQDVARSSPKRASGLVPERTVVKRDAVAKVRARGV